MQLKGSSFQHIILNDMICSAFHHIMLICCDLAYNNKMNDDGFTTNGKGWISKQRKTLITVLLIWYASIIKNIGMSQ